MTLQTAKYVTPVSSYPYGRSFGDTPAYTSQLIDASGEYVGFIFRVPKTGNISTIHFRTGAVSNSQTLNISLVTVDGSGIPTSTAYGGMTAVTQASPAANTSYTVTLGTAASATEGDIVAVKIQFDGTIGSVNIQSFGLGIGANSYVVLNGTKQQNCPIGAIEYDDGSFEPIIGFTPATGGVASTSFNSGTGTFDEWALRFSVPYKVRLRGLRISMAAAAGADFEIINYDGTSAVTGMTLTVDGDQIGNTGSRENVFLWNTTEELAANTTRYLAIRPTTANNVTLNNFTLPEADAWDMLDGNAGWLLARRLNQGAWDTSSSVIVPLIVPIFDQLDDGAGSGSSESTSVFGKKD
jgi:hypothetical protein